MKHYGSLSTFGVNFKFHSNLDFDDSKILTFASFYKQLFRNWRKYLSSSVNIPSSILSQPIWYNKNIKINSKPIYVEEFAKQNIIFLYDLFNTKNELKTWDEIKSTYELSDKSCFKWRQSINSIPKTGNKFLKENQSDSSNLVLLDHQLLKDNRTIGIEKMNSKEIYTIIISFKVYIATSRTYFEKQFPVYNFQWTGIYTLLRKVTINAYLRSFQYRMLNNILYLNKKLHTFSSSNIQLCFFCKIEEETISHLFYYCTHIQDIWNQVQIYFAYCFHFSQLTCYEDLLPKKPT